MAIKSSKGRPRKRPLKPGERVPLGLRVTPELKRALDNAAKQSGRSQSQEAEVRLEQTFKDEQRLVELLDVAYGREGAALLQVFGELIRAVGFWGPSIALLRNDGSSESWTEIPHLFDELVIAFNTVLEKIRPTVDAELPKQFETLLRDVGKRNANALLALVLDPKSSNADLAKTGWADRMREKIGPQVINRLGSNTEVKHDGAEK